MRVLQDWAEVGDATLNMRKNHLPCHGMAYKNWDIWNIYNLVKNMNRNIRILDFGCAGCFVLKLLNHLGFQNIYGIDLYESIQTFIFDELMSILKYPNVKVIRGNGLKSGFHDGFFDLVISLSVIEHNVNIEYFFKEMYRVLKPDGVLYLSTDYWGEKIVSEDKNKVFSKIEIKDMLDFAESTGFQVNKNIPKCKDKVVFANDKRYTFLSMVFKKLKGCKLSLIHI